MEKHGLQAKRVVSRADPSGRVIFTILIMAQKMAPEGIPNAQNDGLGHLGAQEHFGGSLRGSFGPHLNG